MKKAICLLMALLMALGTVTVLAEETAPAAAEEAKSYDTLIVGNTTPAGGSFFLDNLLGNNSTDMDIREMLHGYPLTKWEPGSGSYMINDDVVSGIVVMDNPAGNRVYELALKTDLFYSDGTPITAWDYAFSILLSVSPEMEQIGAAVDTSDRMVGAKEYRNGTAARFAGVQVLNDHLLTVTVRGDFLPYFYELALVSYKPYPIGVIAPGCEVAQDDDGIYIRNGNGEGDPVFTAELLNTTVLDPDTGYLSHPAVVSGPYKLASYDAEAQTVALTVNEYYKGGVTGLTPRIQNIVFTAVSNDDAVEKLNNGEIQLFNKAMKADAVEKGMQAFTEQTVSMSTYPRVGLSFISFNCEKPAVSDPAVRQAIARAFDRDAFMSEYVGEGNGLKVDGYYGVGQWMYMAAVAKTAAYPVAEPGENATRQEKQNYEKNAAAWDALNVDNVKVYDFDMEAAAKTLEDAGWTLGADGIRAKDIDGQTVKLELKLVVPAETVIKAAFDKDLVPNLASLGIGLTVEEMKLTELLQGYYGSAGRDCDMFYLASNFVTDFDPSLNFRPDSPMNYTRVADTELYDIAADMRSTRAGDVVAYCEKWIAFQERFMDILPMIPVYTNVYYDFYTPELQEYEIGNAMSLGAALSGAFYGPVEEIAEGETIVP